MVFYAQGGSREVQGWKGAVQGSQMDPLDGPIAGLVEGDTFFRTHFSGGLTPSGWDFTFLFHRHRPLLWRAMVGAADGDVVRLQ